LQTLACSIIGPFRSHYSINTDTDGTFRNVHKMEVVVDRPIGLLDEPVTLKVQDPVTQAEETVVLRLAN